jgi:RHS repeat-associated protein
LQTSTAHRLHKPAIGCELAEFSAGFGTPTPTTVTTAYDGYGRLKTYSRSTGITNQNFTCNGMDDRVTQAGTGGTVTARYVYDSQGRMLGDYLASSLPADTRGEYIYLTPDAANDNASPYGGDDGMGNYGLLAIATKDTANAPVIHYIHSNHLGVPVLTTNSAGTVITVPPSSYTQPVFPGQMKTYADLYYNRYRDYDPTTGRYIQADPIGLNGGDNAYLYAMGNPVRWIDPLGLEIYNLFPYAEPGMREAADRAYRNLPQSERDGYNHIFGHASKNVFCVYAKNGVNCLAPKAFERWLVDNHVNRTKPIKLWGCSAGQGVRSFAEQLSKNLGGRLIIAATDYTIWTKYQGYKGIKNDGIWRQFGAE